MSDLDLRDKKLNTMRVAEGTHGSQHLVDPWIKHAQDIIYADYGVRVTMEDKLKDLLKFGRNESVGTSYATLMTLPGSELHETYVTTNIITSVSSSSASDTGDLVLEGHTVTGTGVDAEFTFVSQELTLTGTTVVDLTTEGLVDMARVVRMYTSDDSDLVGDIYASQTDTYGTPGVPDTDAKVHCMIPAGNNQTLKTSTTLDNDTFWVVTGFYADMLKKTAAFADVVLETRYVGKAFRERMTISASTYNRGNHTYKPYFIIPPNTDIRLVAKADGSSTDISVWKYQGMI